MLTSDLMGAVVASLLRADNTPQFDPDSVTPGFIGFIITFAVAAIVVLLVMDMVRRIRRVNYRAAVKEKLEREAADAAAPDAPGPDAPGAAPRD